MPLSSTPPALRPEGTFRGLCGFTVMSLPSPFDEAALEAGCQAHFARFLEEIGPVFSVRRSHQLIVIDGLRHNSDLGLSTRDIPRAVLVDKRGAFAVAGVGQMNTYACFYYRERVPRHEWPHPTIDLIIRPSAGHDVRYALTGPEETIFVTGYQVQLPIETAFKERLEQFRGQGELMLPKDETPWSGCSGATERSDPHHIKVDAIQGSPWL